MSFKTNKLLPVLLGLCVSGAFAQSVDFADGSYPGVSEKSLSNAKGGMTASPAVAVQATPEAATADAQPQKVVAPVNEVVLPATVDLVVGKPISQQMSQMGKASGWSVIWEAQDFEVDHRISVSSDFQTALATVIDSAVQFGTRLRAKFYQGNRIVRVTEY